MAWAILYIRKRDNKDLCSCNNNNFFMNVYLLYGRTSFSIVTALMQRKSDISNTQCRSKRIMNPVNRAEWKRNREKKTGFKISVLIWRCAATIHLNESPNLVLLHRSRMIRRKADTSKNYINLILRTAFSLVFRLSKFISLLFVRSFVCSMLVNSK